MKDKSEIIKNNRRFLYHIPKKEYPYIYELFNKYPRIQKMIFQIYELMDNTETLKYKKLIILFTSNKKLKEITGYKQDKTVNPKINYLCSVGFFRKLNDDINEKPYIMQEWKKQHPNKETKNTIILVEFTKKRLYEINEKINELNQSRITPTNMSSLNLRFKGKDEIANEIYYRGRNAYTENLSDEYAILHTDLLEEIDIQIQENGFTNKDLLYVWIIKRMEFRSWSKSKAERFIKLVNSSLRNNYNYHKPTTEEKAKYKLNSNAFIYTSRE